MKCELVISRREFLFPPLVFLIYWFIFRYLCISSVYRLCAECSSLTVTLVITLRKFVSLIFSILYFKNPFTIYHWIGTLLVFAGTVVFTELPQKMGIIEEHKVATKSKKSD